jgi:hypothetical protein
MLALERGVDPRSSVRDDGGNADPTDEAMNTPPPRPPSPPYRPRSADDSRISDWLRLRRELVELHARLEYLRLLVALGVGKSHR